MNFFTELSKRLAGDTPAFFKKLRTFGLWLTGAFGAVLAIPNVPQTLTEIAGYAITTGLVITALATLPVSDTDKLK